MPPPQVTKYHIAGTLETFPALSYQIKSLSVWTYSWALWKGNQTVLCGLLSLCFVKVVDPYLVVGGTALHFPTLPSGERTACHYSVLFWGMGFVQGLDIITKWLWAFLALSSELLFAPHTGINTSGLSCVGNEPGEEPRPWVHVLSQKISCHRVPRVFVSLCPLTHTVLFHILSDSWF